MTGQEGVIEAAALARQIAEIASDSLARDILVLDIRHLSPIADYFVISSVENPRQLRAVTEHIEKELAKENIRPQRREGVPESGWIVLDYGDAIVHLFTAEQREFYRLEELWTDAQRLLVIQ
nr:MAG: ribosome silencing factor [Sphaerobacter thermophilus]